MPTSPRPHRASAQRRRLALLEAAAELVSEVGAGAVTHRAVATRAGVPLSTTSYFFDSIDDLVSEALRTSVASRRDEVDGTEAIGVLAETRGPEEMLSLITDNLLASSPVTQACQVELYLASSRDPELRAVSKQLLESTARRAERLLRRFDTARPDAAAWALLQLSDGAMVHRISGVEADHRDRLYQGLRLLMAAAELSDEEVEDLLRRRRERAEQLAAAGGDADGTSPEPG